MVDEISPEEFAALLESGADVRIVDIRSKPAFDRGHIPGSENVPMHSLTRNVADFVGAETVVTVCPHGQASKQAVRLITSYEGTDDETRVASLEGGLEAWDGDIEPGEDTDREPGVDVDPESSGDTARKPDEDGGLELSVDEER